jgi:hypothetical protein
MILKCGMSSFESKFLPFHVVLHYHSFKAEVHFLKSKSGESDSSDWDIFNTVIYDPNFIHPVDDGELNEKLRDQRTQCLLKFA